MIEVFWLGYDLHLCDVIRDLGASLRRLLRFDTEHEEAVGDGKLKVGRAWQPAPAVWCGWKNT